MYLRRLSLEERVILLFEGSGMSQSYVDIMIGISLMKKGTSNDLDLLSVPNKLKKN
jgi:hypothetical protein